MPDERPQDRPSEDKPRPPLEPSYPNPLMPVDYGLEEIADDDEEESETAEDR